MRRRDQTAPDYHPSSRYPVAEGRAYLLRGIPPELWAALTRHARLTKRSRRAILLGFLAELK